MQRRWIGSVNVLIVGMAALTLFPDRASAQAAVATAPATVKAKAWVAPRTPDGQPDIQGVWTNYNSTPFETFSSSDKPNLYAGDPEGTGSGTGPSAFPVDSTGRKLIKRQSLVVEPSNGRVPVMAWAEE